MSENEIAKHLLNDTPAYEDFIEEMLTKHLQANPELRDSWAKWFLGLDPDVNVDMPQPTNNTSHGNDN